MKTRALGIAIALLCACGGQEQAPPPKPDAPAAPPAATAPAPAPTPAPATAPAPQATAKPDATRGEAIYVANCASCHGPRGEGDGPAGAALDPKPAKHSDGAYMNALTNEHLFKVIKEGGVAVGKSPLMAPWGGMLSDAQIWDLVAFTRSLAKPAYPGTVP